jgi:conjugal transfer mating pair stabilization protein TraN
VTFTVEAGAAPVFSDTWSDGCPALMAECEVQGPAVCIEAAEERLITANTGEQYPVSRDCWRYRTPLLCAGTVTTDAGYCDELVARGCSPLDTECNDGSCEHTYECPLDGWTEPAADCSETSFGLSGIEFDTSVDPSQDFGQAAANLQAMEAAVLDMDSAGVSCTESPPGSGEYDCVGDLQIFNGEDLRCKKKALGFSNCCSRSGWGLGWADACDAEEQQLRVQREQGQCHYVGSYCSEDSIFGCLARKETHCCFRSKLGRIIHEQGRPQLGLDWGSAQSPQCEGFSAEQLAALDFGVIDFSEYFADAFANITGSPDNATLESIIDAYIATLSGDPDC